MSGERSRKSSTFEKSVAQPEYLRVGDAAAMVSVSAKSLRECLDDIPGVVRISKRGIRIPRAGLMAWIRQFQIAR